jgi:hypothetical protein
MPNKLACHNGTYRTDASENRVTINIGRVWMFCLLLPILLYIIDPTLVHASKPDILRKKDITIKKALREGAVRIIMIDTPVVIVFDKKLDSISLQFEQQNNEPVEVQLNRDREGWTTSSIDPTNLVGLSIDFASGTVNNIGSFDLNTIIEGLKKWGVDMEDFTKYGLLIAIDSQFQPVWQSKLHYGYSKNGSIVFIEVRDIED